jgi:uncharacterized protein (DUF952 family)
MTHIYKICSASLWREAQAEGRLSGTPDDIRDGFIHFSTAAQLRETATRHFTGQSDLVLLAVDTTVLGNALRYEASRGGDLFPHLHGVLPVAVIAWARPLPHGPDGRHVFPDIIP